MSGILGRGPYDGPMMMDRMPVDMAPAMTGARQTSAPAVMRRGIFGRKMPATEAGFRDATGNPDALAQEAAGLRDVPLMRDPGNVAQGVNMPSIATPHIKPKFFDKHGAWRDVASFALGTVGDALAMNSEGGRFYLQNKMAERERQNQLADVRLKRQWQMEDADRERNKPQYFSGAEDRLMFDPLTGQTSTVYDAPTDAETYAQAFGFDPGSPEYQNALEDYALRAYGPTATANRASLEGARLNSRMTLEGLRQRNRVSLEGVRQVNRKSLRSLPTYGQANRPSPAPVKRPQASRSRPTATNPQTGQKIEWNGSAWVPVS